MRDSSGEVHNVQNSGFVEACDEDGQVGRVWFVATGGEIHEIPRDSDTAEDYAKLFRVRWIESV